MKKHYKVKQSSSDENLFLLTDARVDALDKSLSHLNLLDKRNTDALWKFVNDIQTDPYSTALSTFSKIADKLIFSQSEEELRENEEVTDLIRKSLNLEVTTGNVEDGNFEVVTSLPKLRYGL